MYFGTRECVGIGQITPADALLQARKGESTLPSILIFTKLLENNMYIYFDTLLIELFRLKEITEPIILTSFVILFYLI